MGNLGRIVRSVGRDWRNAGAEEVYCFPDDWSIREYCLPEIQDLTDAEVALRIDSPFTYRGSSTTLETLARGKHNVVILFDDLSRWTPAFRLAPLVLDGLKRAGVKESNIHFIAAVGSHRMLSQEEMVQKLGHDIVARYQVSNHDCFNDDVLRIGTGTYGTPIRINKEVATSDLVIGLGMITKHGFAYVSGGAKIILPGVAHVETIRSNHRSDKGGLFEKYELKGDEAERRFGPIRVEIDQAAEMLLDRTDLMVVNVALNRKRGITDVFVGDPLRVFHTRAEAIVQRYQLNFEREDKADIGVFRVDSLDPLQYYKGLLPWEEVCEYPIVVGDFSDRYFYQGQRNGRYTEYIRYLAKRKPIPNTSVREGLRKNDTIFIYSPSLDHLSTKLFSRSFYVIPEWKSFMAELRRELGVPRGVAFFHDSYLQIIRCV